MYQVTLDRRILTIQDHIGQIWQLTCVTACNLEETNIIEVTREVFEKRGGYISPFELTLIMLEIGEAMGFMVAHPQSDKNNYRRYLGYQLRERRESLSRSIEETSEDMEISARTIRKIEEGKYSADLELLEQYADYLGGRIDLVFKY